MSIDTTKWAWNEGTTKWAWNQSIPAHPKLVLLAVASLAGSDGYCRSSIEKLAPTLAERCSLSLASVHRYLGWLEARELVTLGDESWIALPEEASR